MPIGAAIGGAVITAGGAVAAGSMSASAQKKAAQTAANSAQSTTDANNALFRETRAQNIGIAQPFYNNGVAAGNALQALLLGDYNGGSGAPAPSPAAGSSGALSGYQTAPVAAMEPDGAGYSGGGSYGPEARDRFNYAAELGSDLNYSDNVGGQAARRAYNRAAYGNGALGPGYVTTPAPAANPVPPTTGTAPGGSALDAFARFRQGTNYQWRFNEGMRGVTGNYATKGALDSGAAEKAKIQFGQNFASGELANYMNLLAGQQNVGLSAGNAIMGVSTGAAQNIAAQNTNAGNVAANAALTSGQASANMWGTVGQTAGQLGGALFQYGMGQMQPRQSYIAPPNYYEPQPVSLPSAQPVAYAPVHF